MKTAEEHNIPLIVLAARNHSLAHRLVLGSVADEVVHWTDRAVLLQDALDGGAMGSTSERGAVLLATKVRLLLPKPRERRCPLRATVP